MREEQTGQLINVERNASFCKPCNEPIVLGTHVKSHARESPKLKDRAFHIKLIKSQKSSSDILLAKSFFQISLVLGLLSRGFEILKILHMMVL